MRGRVLPQLRELPTAGREQQFGGQQCLFGRQRREPEFGLSGFIGRIILPRFSGFLRIFGFRRLFDLGNFIGRLHLFGFLLALFVFVSLFVFMVFFFHFSDLLRLLLKRLDFLGLFILLSRFLRQQHRGVAIRRAV